MAAGQVTFTGGLSKKGDQMKNGCECRKCHSTNSIVLDSRWRNGIRVRTRQCSKCGCKWKTVEVDYWDYVHLTEKR